MKTLIFNGSPRPQGDTASLINNLTPYLDGEVRILDAYRCDISPCIDCRYCWKNSGCSIKDGMQDIYDVGSRLQTYFCGKYFRKDEIDIKPKKGAVILVGGGDGRIEKPYETACTLMHHMNCYDIHNVVCSFNTNVVPAIEDQKALEGIKDIAKFFNEQR